MPRALSMSPLRFQKGSADLGAAFSQGILLKWIEFETRVKRLLVAKRSSSPFGPARELEVCLNRTYLFRGGICTQRPLGY